MQKAYFRCLPADAGAALQLESRYQKRRLGSSGFDRRGGLDIWGDEMRMMWLLGGLGCLRGSEEVRSVGRIDSIQRMRACASLSVPAMSAFGEVTFCGKVSL